MEGYTGDAVLLTLHDMSNPPPSLLHNDGPHGVLVASDGFTIGDGFGPEYTQSSSELLGVASGQGDEVSFFHRPTH